MPKAVLFDLDDTLYDHSASARRGTLAWRARYPELAAVSEHELERANSQALEAVHVRLLAGELSLDEARMLRTRRLFAQFGVTLDEAGAADAHARYRAAYMASRGLVPGSREVLDALRGIDGLLLGIVTNNLVEEQVEKLDMLGISAHFDEVVISEAVGVTKPDPRIFAVALERLGVAARDAVMVGDSLRSDVEGAEAAGIRAVWLDRRGEAAADGRPVLRGWHPAEQAVRMILAD